MIGTVAIWPILGECCLVPTDLVYWRVLSRYGRDIQAAVIVDVSLADWDDDLRVTIRVSSLSTRPPP
jgi:hypothetical protein